MLCLTYAGLNILLTILQIIYVIYFFILFSVAIILLFSIKFTDHLPWFKKKNIFNSFLKKYCMLCDKVYKKPKFVWDYSKVHIAKCYLLVRLEEVEKLTHRLLAWYDSLLDNFKDFAFSENTSRGGKFREVFEKYFENTHILYTYCGFEKFYYYRYGYFFLYYNNWHDCFLSVRVYYKFYKSFKILFSKSSLLNFLNIYKDYQNNTPNFNKIIIYPFTGIFSILKSSLLPILISIIFFMYSIIYFQVNLWRQLAVWLIIGLLFFWLMSGFNFFLKRYSFGKFTSAIVRFWKRTNIYFWLVEGFLFTLFFYYYINSSQEPYYAFDSSALNQTYLPNISNIYISSFVLVATIAYYYYWTLNFPNFSIQQIIFSASLITLYFVYTYIIESYQFYYTITLFFESIWNYLHEFNVWIQETESPRLRVKHQYLILALIAKYWHFIFIFISWLFFVLKVFEQKRSFYTHSGVNLQNLFILFWLNFLVIVQWFKWVERRFLDSSYYWFFTDSNNSSYFAILNELNLLIMFIVLHINKTNRIYLWKCICKRFVVMIFMIY